MNWDAISAITEIVGVLAVLITLVYLSIQIRQNTIATKASSTREIHDSLLSAHLPLYSSNEAARAFRLGCFEPEKLTPDENLQFEVAIYSIFAAFEMFHSQYRDGLIDEEIFNRVLSGIKNLMSTQGVQNWWDRSYADFGKGFTKIVEEEKSKASERSAEMKKYFGSVEETDNDGE